MVDLNTEQEYQSYISGLFDGGGNIYFRISESNKQIGYSITPIVMLRIGKSDPLYGLIDEMFMRNQIRYNISETTTNNKRVEIDTIDNILRLFSFVSEYSVEHKPEIDFIQNTLVPMKRSDKSITTEQFYKLIKTIEEIQPRRKYNDSIKYSTTYFDSQFDIDTSELDSYSIETGSRNKNKTDAYIAGMFDGSGKIRPIVNESASSKHDYNVSLRASITRSWFRKDTVQTYTDYLIDQNINYNINKQDNRFSIYISEVEEISKFINTIKNKIVGNYEVFSLTEQKIIPAIKDDYHKTKQGIHDIVALFEMVLDQDQNRKYTSDYFCSQWDNVQPF